MILFDIWLLWIFFKNLCVNRNNYLDFVNNIFYLVYTDGIYFQLIGPKIARKKYKKFNDLRVVFLEEKNSLCGVFIA